MINNNNLYQKYHNEQQTANKVNTENQVLRDKIRDLEDFLNFINEKFDISEYTHLIGNLKLDFHQNLHLDLSPITKSRNEQTTPSFSRNTHITRAIQEKSQALAQVTKELGDERRKREAEREIFQQQIEQLEKQSMEAIQAQEAILVKIQESRQENAGLQDVISQYKGKVQELEKVISSKEFQFRHYQAENSLENYTTIEKAAELQRQNEELKRSLESFKSIQETSSGELNRMIENQQQKLIESINQKSELENELLRLKCAMEERAGDVRMKELRIQSLEIEVENLKFTIEKISREKERLDLRLQDEIKQQQNASQQVGELNQRLIAATKHAAAAEQRTRQISQETEELKAKLNSFDYQQDNSKEEALEIMVTELEIALTETQKTYEKQVKALQQRLAVVAEPVAVADDSWVYACTTMAAALEELLMQ